MPRYCRVSEKYTKPEKEVDENRERRIASKNRADEIMIRDQKIKGKNAK